MIKLEGISKIYNNKKSNEFYALDKVNVEINKGELVAIIGKSGAGKSTMMHIIDCIDDFEEGTYELNGKDISGVSAKKKAEIRNKEIGIVMQDFALIDEYTVEENVMIPLYFTKGVKNKKDKVKSALEKVGIADLKSKPINKLSGGQKQRVAIARAIVNEPTGALDTKTGQEIMNVFKEINDNGKTVIIITHDMEIAKQCKRIIEIKDGKIVS